MKKHIEQIEREEELLEVIKSHLFKSLEILKHLELKKTHCFCDGCNGFFPSKRIRFIKGNKYCYSCSLKHTIRMPFSKGEIVFDADKPLMLNSDNTKQSQPIIEDVILPITESSVVRPTQKTKINFFEGLSENQINYIKLQTKLGFNPMGFTIYTDTGEIYYFGKLLGVLK